MVLLVEVKVSATTATASEEIIKVELKVTATRPASASAVAFPLCMLLDALLTLLVIDASFLRV